MRSVLNIDSQALAKFVAVDMSRDDDRPLSEAATVPSTLAPYAELSGVGLADFDITNLRKHAEKPLKLVDKSASSRIRGQDKVRGALAPIVSRAGEPRKLLPSRLTLGSKIEFDMERQRRTLHDKLNELAELKSKLSMDLSFHNEKSKPKSTLDDIISKIGPKVAQGDGSPRLNLEDIKELEERAKIHLARVDRKTSKFILLKQEQRRASDQRRAMELERKRRLLKEVSESQVYPSSTDDTVYDYYAVKIQSVVRRAIASKNYQVFRELRIPSIVKIQSLYRGYQTRRESYLLKIRNRAVAIIQSLFRGTRVRISERYKTLVQANSDRSATVIQRRWRGVLGRRRSEHKCEYEKTVRLVAESVDGMHLNASDVRELARRIQHALYGTDEGTAFPPDEVLHLIHMVSLTVVENIDNDEVFWITEISDLSNWNGHLASMDSFTWLMASRILARSEKFIRFLRTVAFGPKVKPPRLVQLPSKVISMLAVQVKNPRWNLAFFSTIGAGAYCCEQLFTWLTSINILNEQQSEFTSFFTTNFPEWLGHFRQVLHEGYKHQTVILSLQHTIELLNDSLTKEGGKYQKIIIRSEIEKITSNIQDTEDRLDACRLEQRTFSSAIHTQEIEIINEIEHRISNLRGEEIQIHDSCFNRASSFSNSAYNDWNLGIKRSELEECRLHIKALQNKMIQLKTQHQINCVIRGKEGLLPSVVVVKARRAGETRARAIISEMKLRSILHAANAVTYDDLPFDERINYEDVKNENLAFLNETESQLVSAYHELEEFMRIENSALHRHEQRMREQSAFFIPTDYELEEQRREDEIEAKLEQQKRLQFIPDKVLTSSKYQQRPLLIIFGRDISAVMKDEAIRELTLLFPAKFVYVDEEASLGLDLMSIQAIFDTGSWAVVSADIGLTKLTRETFLNTLSMVVQSLIPLPAVIVALGGEESSDGPSSVDFHRMKDSYLKSLLVKRAFALESLGLDTMQESMMQLSSLRSPHSNGYIPVLEALAIGFSDFTDIKEPQSSISGVSWNLSKLLLANPRAMLSKLLSLKRGHNNTDSMQIMSLYVKHKSWPRNVERSNDALLHALALIVETWCEIETLTSNGGGLLEHHLFLKRVPQVVSAVVMSSGSKVKGISIENSVSEGWCTPISRLLCAALKQFRVFKTVIDIDGHHYRVNVYRTNERVFFSAYHPISCEVFTSYITLQEASSLFYNPKMSVNGERRHEEVPNTAQEMYEKLACMLYFEVRPPFEKKLVCKRKRVELTTRAVKLNGFAGVLSCYSASMGDLVFSFHVPEFSASFTFTMDMASRGRIAQTSNLKEEKKALEEQNTLGILPYAIDRLRIFPSFSILQSLCSGISVRGVKLKMNLLPFVGRLIYRSIIMKGGVRYILQVSHCSYNNSLLLELYEPRSSNLLTTHVDEVKRKILLRSIASYPQLWLNELIRRIEVIHSSCRIDTTLIQRTIDVRGAKYIASIRFENEDIMTLRLYDANLSRSYESSIALVDMLDMLNWRRRADSKSAKSVLISVQRNSDHNSTSAPITAGLVELLSRKKYLEEFLMVLRMMEKYEIHHECSPRMLLKLTKADFFKEIALISCDKHVSEVGSVSKIQRNTIKRDLSILETIKSTEKIFFRRCQPQPLRIEEDWFTKVKPIYSISVASTPIDDFIPDPDESTVEEIVNGTLLNIITKIEVSEERGAFSNSMLRDIEVPGENKVFKRAIKVLYRENTEIWSRHVSIEVFKRKLWDAEEGVNPSYRFVLYDPNCAIYTESSISGTSRLSLILGKRALDLLDLSKETEMLMYICKYRLVLVCNKSSRDGDDLERGPPYGIEFKTDRIYTANKVTPINAGGEADFEINKSKLFKRGDISFPFPHFDTFNLLKSTSVERKFFAQLSGFMR